MKAQKNALGMMIAISLSTPLAHAFIELDTVTITGTREATKTSETANTINSLSSKEIELIQPAHPSEVMNRIPGVHVNVTNGEGHMTAIRQPISTQALYLYLEDGVPSRSTGFFNHNALYELNMPQSGGMEILKGPGTALYGSDAIGAVINVLTKPAPDKAEFNVDAEIGGHGWGRLLLDGGNSWEDDGVRASLNITHTDGWRDATDYDRQSGTLRWDHFIGDNSDLKTILSFSNIDQQTAGSSRLLEVDYKNNPKTNYTPISYREVDALRLSTAYEREIGNNLFSITPYFRDNRMELLPNWSLSYDPVVYETSNKSIGVLLKYRQDFDKYRSRLIFGADIDYSPGGREEFAITPTQIGNVYTSYTTAGTLYDYDVEFSSFSPYAHLELSPLDKLRITAGLRYDYMHYDYNNKLSTLTTGNHRRPADTTVDFKHLSPKLGFTYEISPEMNGFFSYNHVFRVPSEGQLFRQGRAINTIDLDPIKVDSFEIGLRGKMSDDISYDASVFYIRKKDDILTYRHPDNTRETVNAGETSHKGIELGLNAKLSNELDLAASYSVTRHTYEDWLVRTGEDFTNNDMPSAPESMTNVSLSYHPPVLNGGRAELEWSGLGNYWMDDANTHEYRGHNLINFRINYPVSSTLKLSARIMNLTDERYATAASYRAAAFGNPEKFEFAPGLPRTFYASMSYQFN